VIRGSDLGENHIIVKKHGLLAVIPVRNKKVPIYLRGKQGNDEKTFARRVQKKVNS